MKRLYLIILLISLVFISGCSSSGISIETAKCIASNSKMYISTGCHACKMQEEIFGKSFSYLNVINCKINPQECIDRDITAVPTWFINGKKVEGSQTEAKLKELTGC